MHTFDSPLRSWRKQLIAESKPEEALKIPEDLYIADSMPGMVIRKGDVYSPDETEYQTTLLEEVTEELIYLDEELSLRTPGLSMARKPYRSGQYRQPYLLTHHIEGLSFLHDAASIPQEVAIKAGRAVFAYNARVLERGRYCSDILLRQIMWGKEDPHQESPELYMIDPDPLFSKRPVDPERAENWDRFTRHGLSEHMVMDVLRVKNAYGSRSEAVTVLKRERLAIEEQMRTALKV